MLRDASHRQVIQKFSFIESLNLSRASQPHPQTDLGRLNRDRAFSFQRSRGSDPGILATQTSQDRQQQAAAMVTTSRATATIDSNWYEPTADYSLSLAEIIHSTTDHDLPTPTANSSNPARRIGKIVFALACSYGLFVGYWLFGNQGSKILTLLTGGRQVVLSKSEVQFIDYMERSLVQIDRDLAAQKQDNDEVVYVPVYTPNLTANAAPRSTLPSSNPPPMPQPQAAPPAPLAIPAPPPLPSPTPITDNSAPNTAIATKPKIDHTLIGVLELGADRSAALVKVGGKTRRIWLGEKIHADGWILKSIANQQATISHQGQVRSISVGETF